MRIDPTRCICGHVYRLFDDPVFFPHNMHTDGYMDRDTWREDEWARRERIRAEEEIEYEEVMARKKLYTWGP